jgi:hypothetical protein
LHAYDELYRESKQFLTSVSAGTSQHDSGALQDVLCNQQNVLADIQEQLRHVWVCFLFTVSCVPALMLHEVSIEGTVHLEQVQVNLDSAGCIHFARLMRVETTIEALFNQLPPLVHHVLMKMEESSQLQFRLLPPSNSRRNGPASKAFDVDCSAIISLKDIMKDYLPGTLEFEFQLLCNSRPIDFEKELIRVSQHQLHDSTSLAQTLSDSWKVLL